MQANPEKFQFLAISSNDKNSYQLKLSEDTIINSEKHVKALGIIIDDKLNFSEHVSAICKKSARQLNALSRIAKFRDINSHRIMYKSFVDSNFYLLSAGLAFLW